MTDIEITPLMLTSASARWSEQNRELAAAVERLNSLTGEGFGEAVAPRLRSFAEDWSAATKTTSRRAQDMADHLSEVDASFQRLDEACSSGLSRLDPGCRSTSSRQGTVSVGTTTISTGTAWHTAQAQKFAEWLGRS